MNSADKGIFRDKSGTLKSGSGGLSGQDGQSGQTGPVMLCFTSF